MTLSKRRRKCITGLFLIIFISIFGSLYYQLHTYYSFDPFFPPSGNTTYFMELTYPPISSGKVQETLLDASFNIISNKTIAEGVNMSIVDPRVRLYGGTPRNKYITHNISGVNIAFQYARPMGGSLVITAPFNLSQTTQINLSQIQYVYHNLPPGAAFKMNESDIYPIPPHEPIIDLNLSHGYLKGVLENHPFSFPVSGDYSPSIILEFDNGSVEGYTYDEIKLHVPSTSEIRTQELNQIDGFIALALLLLSFTEVCRIFYEWIKSVP
jgi:hypothetical protein